MSEDTSTNDIGNDVGEATVDGVAVNEASNDVALKNLIEACLLAAGRPMTLAQLAELFEERDRPANVEIRAALEALHADYETRGIELREVASGWRIQVRSHSMDVVSRLWQERPSRYSRALLETLALIAYRQPITRSEIEEIRGVAISSTIMRTLQERNWLRVLGHREVPGRPELLGTTREFLDYFGLKSLDQLPTLAELKDMDSVGVQLELPAGDVGMDANLPHQASAAGEGMVSADDTGAADGAASADGTGSADGGAPDDVRPPVSRAGSAVDGETENSDADDAEDSSESEDDSDEDGHGHSTTLVAGADGDADAGHPRREPSAHD